MDHDLILAAESVAYRYPAAPHAALAGVSLAVRAGEMHAVLGPNGSGKTTLLRVALGLVPPSSGRALVLGRDAGGWSRRDLARIAAVVPQHEEGTFPQRVRDAVALGRYPHLSAWGGERAADRAAVDSALAACDATHLAARWVGSLSGGEAQRVRLARALAQEPRLLVLDEPTTSLDLRHEMELFERARALVERHGLAVLVITHHVNLAARFADRVHVLAAGQAVAQGAPADVLTAAIIERVFEWPVVIQPFDGAPQIIPLRQPLS
jgi:iron complex transport system ATP-binding protein